MAAENSSGHGWRQRVKAADIARPFAVGVPAADGRSGRRSIKICLTFLPVESHCTSNNDCAQRLRSRKKVLADKNCSTEAAAEIRAVSRPTARQERES